MRTFTAAEEPVRESEMARAGGRACAVQKTTFGWVGAAGTERGLAVLTLPRPDPESALAAVAREFGPSPERPERFADLFALLDRYFAGERVALDLPIAPEGTPFQLAVWEAVHRIPCGETRTYGDVAREVGCPHGPRAVGQAVGANPLAIVVPCHRVLAADGHIGGYGGGLDLKRRLLRLEGVTI